ncbi:MAG: protein phosphatase 2C domain-containing protein [Chloroflexi bacterium]|nr:protein phosphatase 2C domain-containing protein [Chloroflexota bacterium]MBU1661344.1 protein phosphatase 2C domain-containing protein [Chloroflexota bacterium]
MIPSERSHLYAAAVTHPGMSGKNNEDCYAVSAHYVSETDSTPSVLAIVADGVGGHFAGEIAAEIAVETISQTVADSDASNPREILENAIILAGQAVNNQSNLGTDRQGMGSTCACAWVIGDKLYIASVGDSRIYLLRDGQIQQLTTDHTWVQEAIEHGIIKPEQARDHPRAHIIRRHLGSKKPVVPDMRLRLHPEETDEQTTTNQGTQLRPGDQLLLCSDGLTDLVDDDEILAVIQNGVLEESLDHLVDKANARGGHDNITILTLQIPPTKEEHATTEQAGNKSRFELYRWAYLGIGIVIIIMLTVLVWYASRPAIPPAPTPTVTTVDGGWRMADHRRKTEDNKRQIADGRPTLRPCRGASVVGRQSSVIGHQSVVVGLPSFHLFADAYHHGEYHQRHQQGYENSNQDNLRPDRFEKLTDHPGQEHRSRAGAHEEPTSDRPGEGHAAFGQGEHGREDGSHG